LLSQNFSPSALANLISPSLDKCAMRLLKYYIKKVKRARRTLQNKEKIYIIYSVKWQTRAMVCET
ncbi:MAG: hypothetical protein LUD69_07515, partial [Oscillospiraceae bacterium]|nr:hypothetical protein [Oscillospiraceae bacterium]